MPGISALSIDRSGRTYRWCLTLAGVSAFFTMVFSSTIANVAVPDVMGAYGVGQDKAQFLATGFLATMTASLLLNAWIMEKLGQRMAFALALSLFFVGSLICGFSPSLEMIIFGRVVQGFASGIIQPLVMIVLFQVFPPEKRGMAMAIFSMGVVLALALGPVIGGLTIDHLNWRFIFFVPIPVVVISLILGLIFMPPRSRLSQAGSFDALGYVLLCVTLFCLMTAIADGQRKGWDSDGILLLFAITLVAGTGFVFSQLRERAGLLDLTLIRNRRFAAALTVSFVFGIANFTTIYIYPVFGQLVQGYTATMAGFLILPGSLLAALVVPITGRLADSAPPLPMILIGLAIFAASNLLMAETDVNTMFLSVAFFIFVGRVGIAFIAPAMNSAALRALPGEKLNQGAGILNFCFLLGGATGINSLVVVLERRTQFYSDAFAATQTSANAATRELLGYVRKLLGEDGIPDAMQQPVALNYLGEVVQAQANTLGFRDGFLAIAIVTFCAMVPAVILGFRRR